MGTKNLGATQLLYLSICGFGIQFASSLQTTNTSGLYKYLGVDSSNLSYLWLAAPIAGLLIQPIVGQFSDSTMTRFGKRNPYIFGWGMLAFLSMMLLPMSTNLWMAAGLMWILSCSVNGCTEALRALIGDIAPNKQKTTVFSLQTIFCGVGAGIAAFLPYFLGKFLDTHYSSGVPKDLQISFYTGGLLIAAVVIWLVTHLKEDRQKSKRTLLTHKKQQYQEHYHKTNTQKILHTFKEIWVNAIHMPKVIRDFAFVQLFTWTGLFCLWLYLTPAISQHILGLPIGVTVGDDPRYAHILHDGVRWTNIYTGIYQFTSVIFALVLPKLAERFPARLIHAASLFIGAAGLIAFGFISNPYLIIPSMVGFGILWGSIMTMPFAILCVELPKSKMGVYLGLFNMTITLPQIICGLTIGSIYKHIFQGHAVFAIVFAGAMILIASAIMLYQVHETGIPFVERLRERIFGLFNSTGKPKNTYSKV